MLSILGLMLLLLATPAQSQQAPQPAGRRPARPATERSQGAWSGPFPGQVVRLTEAPGLRVFFKAAPLAPGLAQAFQGERDRAPRLRALDWPVARLETTLPFSLGEARLPPANYALILIPSRGGQPMLLEIRRIAAGEFLGPDMMPAPAGETVERIPFKGTFGAPVVNALAIEAKPRAGGGAVVTFRYGDWQAALQLLP
jgi:hypothetical protein